MFTAARTTTKNILYESTLQFGCIATEMGCDGGTIPKRDELVRVKKKPEQKDKDAELSYKWKHCAISQQILQTPIVACGLGRLYSKSSVLECLLNKDTLPASITHIKNMKDIKDLKLTKNPAYDVNAEKSEGAIDKRGSPYICPIIGLEMSGRFRFIFLWSCGCVMSERSLKEVKVKICHLCQQPFSDNDIVIINGGESDVESLNTKLTIRQAKLKAEKKNKSKLAVETSTSVGPPALSKDNAEQGSSKTDDVIPLMLPKIKRDGNTTNQTKPHKRTAPSTSMHDPVYKKTKNDYSVAEDPKATNVYKSLFTSHQSDKDQKRAHWITYNPFYN